MNAGPPLPLQGGLDLSGPPRRVHLVAIGGAGMNGLATLLVSMGHHVSGSDMRDSPALARLKTLGVSVSVGHDPALVHGVDLVAHSTAVKPENPELMEAARLGTPIFTRPQLMGAVCQGRRVVAISGTHGKTTTTAMLCAVLAQAGWAPGFLVGGELADGNGGSAPGGTGWLIVEADESDGTFLNTRPYGVIVTNLEADHLDFYGDLAHLEDAFSRFVSLASGPRVLCADDVGAARLAARAKDSGGHVTTYGLGPSADAQAQVTSRQPGRSTFELVYRGAQVGEIEVGVPGTHNVLNAAAALTMALELVGGTTATPESAAMVTAAHTALGRYRGVARRLQFRGRSGGVTFIDDYAHMPAEVRATLEAVRQSPWERVVAVFQPHRFSRTAALWGQFGDAFALADVVVVTGVYPAGEAPVPGVEGDLVAQAVRDSHPGPVLYVQERADVAELVHHLLKPGDLCLTMGAGDITTLADQVTKFGADVGGTER